jgi:hypothetical protein
MTMVGDMKKLIKNEKGQAIFELILFLPFLVFMVSIFYTIGNSISGSINQQKAVRNYFYFLVKNNSYINTAKELESYATDNGMKSVGYAAIGWREKSVADKVSFAPCFQFASMLRNNSSNETCDGSERGENDTSHYIRVFTFYGVCGPAYMLPAEGGAKMILDPTRQNNPTLCSLIQ